MTSADAIVDIFETEGVEYVFGLPGSQILEVVDVETDAGALEPPVFMQDDD